jgi:uncharacterized membrane protein YdbT with pleckstrin-like domain
LGYIERTLVEGESVLQRGRLHWIVYGRAPLFVLAGIIVLLIGGRNATLDPHFTEQAVEVGLVLLLVGASLGVGAFIRRVTTEIAVTSRRFVVKRGLIRRSVMEIGAGQIESVTIHQSIPGRLLGYGTLIVSGTGSGIDPVKAVANPLALRKALDRLYRPD